MTGGRWGFCVPGDENVTTPQRALWGVGRGGRPRGGGRGRCFGGGRGFFARGRQRFAAYPPDEGDLQAEIESLSSEVAALRRELAKLQGGQQAEPAEGETP
jgi:hypothetical protein